MILLGLLALVSCSRSKYAWIAFAIFLLPSAFNFARDVYALSVEPASFSRYWWHARTKKYLEVGEALYSKYPDARVLAPEIGALGYGFRGEILDAIGIATPAALQFHPLLVPEQRSYGALGAVPPRFVAHVRPEFVVALDCFVEALLLQYQESYHLVREPVFTAADLALKREQTLWGSQYLNIFIRKDLLNGARPGRLSELMSSR